MSSPITKLACLLLLAPLAISSALPAPKANDKRSCVTKDMTYSSCTSCAPASEPDCTTQPYYHAGASGGSCKDRTVPFNKNFCTTFGSVVTPFGQGIWKEADGCKSSNDRGTYGGTVVPKDGGDDWSCSCVNAGDGKDGRHNENCGEQYVCDTIWDCACSKCT